MFNKRLVSSIALAVLLILSLITTSVAWFASFIEVHTEGEFEASSIVSYFAGGDGTETDPYIVMTPKHLYNLSWLQNQGAFTGKKFYFQASDLEGNPVTIDMAGMIYGSDSEHKTGAIPPIGTKEKPFEGYLNGCGSVIKNLWVSTRKADWKEQPEGAGDYSSNYVGLFGAIGGEAIIEDFILDTVEVTTHINGAKVGIICGYVNAMLRNVGVYNGIISVVDGASCTSNYSLLGEKDPRIVWDDMPKVDSQYDEDVEEGDDAGGDLVIDPNDYDNEGAEKFTELTSGYEPVPYSIEGTAYYAGPLSATNPNISQKALWDMRNYNTSTGNGAVEFTTNDNSSKVMKKIGSIYSNYGTSSTVISPGIPKSYSGNSNLLYADVETDKGFSIPAGCIWFKPSGGGTVALAFASTNNSGSRYAMLYACERTTNGQDECLKIVKTVEFEIVKSNKFKMGQVFYYEYNIPDGDKGKYEYLIAGSNISGRATDFGFLALALAGVDITGGGESTTVQRPTNPGEFATIMYDVDYVISTDVDISADSYVNHQSLLKINSASSGSKIYYLAAGLLNESTVYYCTGGADITDIAAQTPKKSSPKNKDDTFEGTSFSDRTETK